MIVAARKQEYHVYVAPVCCGKPMKCNGVGKVLRYFKCGKCGKTTRLAKSFRAH